MTTHLCHCGGGRAHHTNDVACWCPRCLAKTVDKRCTNFAPHTPISLPKPQPGPTQDQPAAAAQPAKRDIPEAEQQVLSHIAQAGNTGASVGEVATLIGLKPHRVKRILVSLEKTGQIALSGQIRQVGDDTEALWLAETHEPSVARRQATLWE